MLSADDLFVWIEMNPKKYYKDGKLYGLVGTKRIGDTLYVASMVKDFNDDFTLGMIRDIILLYNTNKICLLTDVKSKQKLIARTLKRYNFKVEIVDGMMYSIGGKNVNT